MKKKFMMLALALISCLCVAVGFTACSGGGSDDGDCEHATLVSTAESEASCTEDGHIAYWYCPDCGKYFSDAECTTEISLSDTVIAATGHDYTTTFSWSSDYSSATATYVCKNDSTHTGTVECTITPSTIAATCTEEGSITYTATATLPDSSTATDTKIVTIPATDHDYDTATFTWSSDGTSATATRVCKNDESHVETVTAVVEKTASTDPTCETAGTITYTATATFANGDTATDEKTVDGEAATGHNWTYGDAVWTVNTTSGAYEATITRTCTNDATHVETVTGDVESETDNATCVTAGDVVYTATFTFSDNEVKTATKTVTGEALGHQYEAEFAWAEDYTSATVTLTCTRDGCDDNTEGHKITADATVTTTADVAATCTEDGYITYVASYGDYSQEKTIIRPATDHSYGDYVCDATGHWQVCSVCNEKSEVEEHTMVGDEGRYVCSVCGYAAGGVYLAQGVGTAEVGDNYIQLYYDAGYSRAIDGTTSSFEETDSYGNAYTSYISEFYSGYTVENQGDGNYTFTVDSSINAYVYIYKGSDPVGYIMSEYGYYTVTISGVDETETLTIKYIEVDDVSGDYVLKLTVSYEYEEVAPYGTADNPNVLEDISSAGGDSFTASIAAGASYYFTVTARADNTQVQIYFETNTALELYDANGNKLTLYYGDKPTTASDSSSVRDGDGDDTTTATGDYMIYYFYANYTTSTTFYLVNTSSETVSVEVLCDILYTETLSSSNDITIPAAMLDSNNSISYYFVAENGISYKVTELEVSVGVTVTISSGDDTGTTVEVGTTFDGPSAKASTTYTITLTYSGTADTISFKISIEEYDPAAEAEYTDITANLSTQATFTAAYLQYTSTEATTATFTLVGENTTMWDLLYKGNYIVVTFNGDTVSGTWDESTYTLTYTFNLTGGTDKIAITLETVSAAQTVTYKLEVDDADHTHSYTVPVWAWTDDYSSATLVLKCDSCDEEITVGEVDSESVTTAATCTSTGSIVYTVTKEYNGDTYTDTYTVTLPKAHTLEYHEAVAPTASANGNLEYWYCTTCQKYFTDEAGENEVEYSDLVLTYKTSNTLYNMSATGLTTASTDYLYPECDDYSDYAHSIFGGTFTVATASATINSLTRLTYKSVSDAVTDDTVTTYSDDSGTTLDTTGAINYFTYSRGLSFTLTQSATITVWYGIYNANYGILYITDTIGTAASALTSGTTYATFDINANVTNYSSTYYKCVSQGSVTLEAGTYYITTNASSAMYSPYLYAIAIDYNVGDSSESYTLELGENDVTEDVTYSFTSTDAGWYTFTVSETGGYATMYESASSYTALLDEGATNETSYTVELGASETITLYVYNAGEGDFVITVTYSDTEPVTDESLVPETLAIGDNEVYITASDSEGDGVTSTITVTETGSYVFTISSEEDGYVKINNGYTLSASGTLTYTIELTAGVAYSVTFWTDSFSAATYTLTITYDATANYTTLVDELDDASEYTITHEGEDTAILADYVDTVYVWYIGDYQYWYDWSAVENNDVTASYSNGTITWSTTTNALGATYWYANQLFYKNSALTVGTTYMLSLTIVSDVAVDITVNGTVVSLVAGTNTVKVIYTETTGASISIQLGVNDTASTVNAISLTISDIAWYTETSASGDTGDDESGDAGDTGDTGDESEEDSGSTATVVTLSYDMADYYDALIATSTDEDGTESKLIETNETTIYFLDSGAISTDTDDAGVLVYTTTAGTSDSSSASSKYLQTGGKTQTSNSVSGRYFTIDLSDYEGYTVSISVTMCSGGSSSRSLLLSTSNTLNETTDETAYFAIATSSGTSDEQTLTYTGTVTDENSLLYLTCTASVRVYSITITLTPATTAE